MAEELDVDQLEVSLSDRSMTIYLDGIHECYGQVTKKTGYTLWGAAHQLADAMVTPCAQGGVYERFIGARVIELGTGLGLCGILASFFPGTSVIITDGDSKVLEGALKNVTKNESLAIGRKLRWGLPPSDMAAFCGTLKGADDVSERGRFDIVLGSDIIYDKDVVPALLDTVVYLLRESRAEKSGKEGIQEPMFLLGYHRRNVPMEYVFTVAAEKGLLLGEELIQGAVYSFYLE